MQEPGISADKFRVVGVYSQELHEIWDNIAPGLEKALLRGRAVESVDTLRIALANRTAQLWLVLAGEAIVAVAVTEMDLTKPLGILRIVALAGEGFDCWGSLLERALSTYAVAHGCKYLIFSGRYGWTRKLILRNWTIESVNLAKEL